MSNIYWPVYQNLEKEVEALTFSIHINDKQLGVYSPKISDLILRAAADIESLSKELYKACGGKKSEHLRFDDVCIKHLNTTWKLDQKVVVISSPACFQSIRDLLPFKKTEAKSASKTGKLTYSWNNAYQNLKHDRGNSLEFGSLKYLFDIMAALFLLNLYYRDIIFDLGKQADGLNFSEAQGSRIFSIKLHHPKGHDGQGAYVKNDDFDECVYFVDWTKDTNVRFIEAIAKMTTRVSDLHRTHHKMVEYIANNNVSEYQGTNLAWDVLGKDQYAKHLQQANFEFPIYDKAHPNKYEAVLNKDQLAL